MRLSTWFAYYIFTFLLVSGSIHCIISEITYVKRDVGDKFGSVSEPTKNCPTFRAFRIGASECQCNNQHSTFLFSKKTCVSNSVIQNNFGMTSESSRLMYLGNQDSKTKPYIVLDLHSKKQNISLRVKTIISNCKVSMILHYINDENGNQMSQDVGNIFTIDKEKEKLKWQKMSNNIMSGRVLMLTTENCKVTFENAPRKIIRNPFIIFKAEGQRTFPPSTTITPTSAISSSTSISLKPVSSVAPVGPTNPGSNNKQTDDKQSAPVEAIVGSIFAVIAVAVIIILIYIWKRRKSRPDDKASKGPKDSKDNPMYGNGNREIIDLSNQKQGPKSSDNEFEYDYAAVDGDPRSPGNRASNGTAPGIYQSLDRDHTQESVYMPLERGQDNPDDQSNGYDKVERPLFKPPHKGPTDPLYNVLERSKGTDEDYLQPGVHIDKNKKPSPAQAPPNYEAVYNVLEDPNAVGEDEPDYNVLEDPNEQDEPDYNVLEDPDDNYDNAAVEGNMGHPSSRNNAGYASTIDIKPKPKPKPVTKNYPVYAAPDGPISEPTYQPLQTRVPDESVYQPLDRTSKVVNDDQPLYHVLESGTSNA